MNLYAGTSGYSYKEWKGDFYPSDVKPADMLRAYASQLPSVEINNTFYRMPRTSVLESWAEQVPESFRFSIKATRRITHIKRLKNANDETEFFLGNLEVLGPRLGVVLYQLPPNMKKDLARLEDYLGLVPPGLPAAFEFRHPSWFEEDVQDLLRSRGMAFCVADTEDKDQAPLVASAPFGYLRLRKESYSDQELKDWAGKIRDLGWSHAFVYFKHEDECAGPKMAKRFLEITGQKR